MSTPQASVTPAGVGIPLPRAMKMHNNSLTEPQVRALTSLYCLFGDPQQALPFCRALFRSSLRSSSPDPALVDGILCLLRDLTGEPTRDRLVDEAIDDELDSTLDLHTLMRTGSIATRLMTALYRTEGAEWLTKAIGPLFDELSKLDHPLEFDTKKLPPETPPEQIQRAAKEFQGIILRFLINLYDAAADLPDPILRAVVRASKAAEKKFPTEGDKRGGGLVVGNGMLMLRYISPAVMSPAQFNAKVADLGLPFQLSAALTLSKVLQVIANGVNVKGPDSALAPIAAFVESQFKPCIDFILSICDSPMPSSKAPPNLSTPPQQISPEIFTALVAVQKEVEAQCEKICSEIPDPALVQVVQNIAKPPKSKPAIFTTIRNAVHNAANSSSSSSSSSATAPVTAATPASTNTAAAGGAPAASSASGADAAPSSASAGAVPPPGGVAVLPGELPHDLHHVATTPAYSGLDLTDPSVGECHLLFDDILANFRRSVLAASGANFERVVADHKKLQQELAKEREGRIFAEKSVAKLEEEVKKLQEEIARLKANQRAPAGRPVSGSPAPSAGGNARPMPKPNGAPRPEGAAGGAPAAAPAAANNSNNSGGGGAPAAGGANRLVAMPEPKNLSCMPGVPFIRQAVGLLDDLIKMVPEKMTVPLTLYLARLAGELQRMQRTPLEEEFAFNPSTKYVEAAFTPKDGNITMETEKIKTVLGKLPELLMGFRNWYQEQLSDGKYLPREYAKVMLRAQDTVQVLLGAVDAVKGK